MTAYRKTRSCSASPQRLGLTRLLVYGSLIAISCLGGAPLQGQSLNPRAYWPAPSGTNVISFGYSYTAGGFLADPSLPVEDVDAETHGLQGGYVRYFSLGGRTASIGLTIPRVEATVRGLLEGDERSRVMSGYADSSLQLSINVKGAPTMTREDFRSFLQDPRPVVGLTVKLQAPTGAYDSERIVNLGTNRWSIKPEIGHIDVRGPWVIETTAGIRFFGTNDDFQGQIREQDPIASGALHFGRAVQRKRPDIWFSLGIGFAYGGRTTVDGVENNDLQQNWRGGGTLALPLGRGQAIRFQISTSLRTSIGEDSTAALLSYSKLWN